jgi:hypothetical protein
MIVESFCGLRPGALLERAHVEAMLGLADSLTQGHLARYDLDGMGSWRPWSVERACIDAMTQRTAMLRFDGPPASQGMLALGKRGEPPTLIARADLPDPAAARDALLACLRIPSLAAVIDRCGVSPVEARAALYQQAKGMTSAGGLDLGCWWMALRAQRLTIPTDALTLAGASCDRVGDHWLITLLPSPTTPTPDAVQHWLSIARALAP